MGTRKPTHIFIVDNNKLFVNMLDYIFSKDISYRFLDFKSGEDCLKNLELDPALVVLDYRLPGMNGYETLLEIREQNPSVQVLTLSSAQDGKLPPELLNAGAFAHILKDGNETDKVIGYVEEFFSGKMAAPVKREKRPWLRRKLYYALIGLALLVSLGYYYYA
jgi:DNA-binding NarL/FixJ family response regulator